MRNRFPLLATVASIAITAIAARSDASVSVALSLDEVARASTLVARVTPVDASAAWEDGRIVTTTRLRVERMIAGGVATELRVRTLGGVVEGIGQRVEGEPSFEPTASSIVFLEPAPKDAFRVVGRAQGQLALQKTASGEAVRLGPAGALVRRVLTMPRPQPSGPLMAALDGAPADDAVRLAAEAWRRTHAP